MIITKTKKVNEISMSVLYIYSVFFFLSLFFCLEFFIVVSYFARECPCDAETN